MILVKSASQSVFRLYENADEKRLTGVMDFWAYKRASSEPDCEVENSSLLFAFPFSSAAIHRAQSGQRRPL